MTNQGGRQPPPDDRTLLDPLNADELKALREARQKMQSAKGGSPVAHQMVVGPDQGEDIGDAPTRAMPALPQFENQGASLERIPTGEMPAQRRGAPPPQGQRPPPAGPQQNARPQQPMSMAPTQPGGPNPQGGPPTAGPTGFGENTLLWMAPPKPPAGAIANPTGVVSAAEIAKAKQAQKKRTVKTIGAVVVVALIVVAMTFALRPQERAVIDLHTNPPKAMVKINGTPTKNQTPMKLNLVEGSYEIEVSLDGYKPNVFTLNVEHGAAPSRRDIELEPISKAGLLTVAIAVQPVASIITVDGTVYMGKRNVNIANVDPNSAHKITIEAGGYIKIDQDIPAGQLKKTYNFFLQQDEKQKPQ
jgi:PEGA domain-containing protein